MYLPLATYTLPIVSISTPLRRRVIPISAFSYLDLSSLFDRHLFLPSFYSERLTFHRLLPLFDPGQDYIYYQDITSLFFSNHRYVSSSLSSSSPFAYRLRAFSELEPFNSSLLVYI